MITIRKSCKKSVKRKKINRRKYIILILIGIAIATIILVLTKAKYKFENNTFHTQNSEMFYFESDILSVDTTEEITYSDWVDSSDYSIKFYLKNYMDELRYNSLETPYTISATTENDGISLEIYINGNKKEDGTMIGNNKVCDEIEIKIIQDEGFNIGESGIQINIEATSISPYSKTLTKTINIIKEQKVNKDFTVNLENKEEKDYARLFIHTSSSFRGTLKIAYDSNKVAPDMLCTILQNSTKEQIESGNYYYIEVELEANSNYQIDFIKNVQDIELKDDLEGYDIVIG